MRAASSCAVAGFFVVSLVRTSISAVVASVLALSIAGCAQDGTLLADGFVPERQFSPDHPAAPDQVTREMETGALPEASKLVAEGKLQFSQGHYGLAIDAF